MTSPALHSFDKETDRRYRDDARGGKGIDPKEIAIAFEKFAATVPDARGCKGFDKFDASEALRGAIPHETFQIAYSKPVDGYSFSTATLPVECSGKHLVPTVTLKLRNQRAHIKLALTGEYRGNHGNPFRYSWQRVA